MHGSRAATAEGGCWIMGTQLAARALCWFAEESNLSRPAPSPHRPPTEVSAGEEETPQHSQLLQAEKGQCPLASPSPAVQGWVVNTLGIIGRGRARACGAEAAQPGMLQA